MKNKRGPGSDSRAPSSRFLGEFNCPSTESRATPAAEPLVVLLAVGLPPELVPLVLELMTYRTEETAAGG